MPARVWSGVRRSRGGGLAVCRLVVPCRCERFVALACVSHCLPRILSCAFQSCAFSGIVAVSRHLSPNLE